ncbi:hypothetical protein Acj9p098 [Acinetobacter phage Acj9]|uniref:Uncharacterized protein n=1 Tax=Acinetobacter phage Acj9 TaxID=760939 RepID=E5EPN2_9CAUD|nr:hypothetical protein Acj9p098 [Acinetobacter phage Acj9]ADG59998.1 hypothetical protein Acj9p098 [Acinetobacter phage Acj9]
MSHSTTNLLIAAALKEYYNQPKSLDDLVKMKRTQLAAQQASQASVKTNFGDSK